MLGVYRRQLETPSRWANFATAQAYRAPMEDSYAWSIKYYSKLYFVLIEDEVVKLVVSECTIMPEILRDFDSLQGG